jgi:hypothetical protein
MARPRVADGGDGLQIWMVSANILNKQSRTADKGWSTGRGLSEGLTSLRRKKSSFLRNVTKVLGIARLL